MKSIFKKILKDNIGLPRQLMTEEKISSSTIYKIANSWRGYSEYKHRIFCYLIEKNYIRLGQYSLTELFEVKEENELQNN